MNKEPAMILFLSDQYFYDTEDHMLKRWQTTAPLGSANSSRVTFARARLFVSHPLL